MAEASDTPTAVGDETQPSSSDHQSSSNKVDSTNNNTTAATGDNNNKGGGGAGGDDDMLLVTEFPPPPYYYTLSAQSKLTPPPIPSRAFQVAAKRVITERQKAKEESDRIRLDAGLPKGSGSSGDVGAVKGEGNDSSKDETKVESTKQDNDDTASTTSSIDPNDPNEQVVAVFGEIVEDPTLVTAEDECDDPVEIRENVKRLNQDVINGYLRLVKQLVNDPNDNK